MNTKQRRTARRKHMAEFGAQLVELRLLGANSAIINDCMKTTALAKANIPSHLNRLRSQPK